MISDYISFMANVQFSYLKNNGDYFNNSKKVIFKQSINCVYELKTFVQSLGEVHVLLDSSSDTDFVYTSAGNFIRSENSTFQSNLTLIDSKMPEILSYALKAYFEGKASLLSDICKYITTTNPLGFDQSSNHKFYEHKLKRFLSEVALGMMPNTTWTGQYDGTEGYIVIKEDGDVVCYNIINRNLFEDYLLANTKFDTPSSTRHMFGSIYDVGSESFFKLNLQIRFI